MGDETQVSSVEVADIVDSILHHHEAIQSQTKGKTVPLPGIDSSRTEDIGVDHPTGEEFQPPHLAAHRAAPP